MMTRDSLSAADVVRLYDDLVERARGSVVDTSLVNDNSLVNYGVIGMKDRWVVYFTLNGEKHTFEVTPASLQAKKSWDLLEHLGMLIASKLRNQLGDLVR